MVLITGASSGLGRTLAIDLSAQGAKLSLIARNKEALEETRRLCKNEEILVIPADVTEMEACQQAIEATLDRFGQIDYLILNAGITMWAKVEELKDPSVFKTIMETNYLGAAYCAYYALPHLKKSKGMIVAISSTQGKIPVPYHTGYTASKHAMEAFFNALRMESAVDVLVVSPGWIRDTLLKEKAAVRNSSITPLQKGMSPAYCSRKILKAMKKQKRDLMLPHHYRLLPTMRTLFPRFLDWIVRRTVKSH